MQNAEDWALEDLERRSGEARQIAEEMKRLNVSTMELARATGEDGDGVHYQTIRRMVRGDRIPRDKTLRRLKAALQEVADG